MARPPAIQKLRHGRVLSGGVFRWFVETWNWMTAVVDNFRGDADRGLGVGYISVDRGDPDAPVLRLVNFNKLAETLNAASDRGCFRILSISSSGTASLGNCYWRRGGRLYSIGTDGAASIAIGSNFGPGKTLCLRTRDTYDEAGEADLVFATTDDLEDASDAEYSFIPLYQFKSDYSVLADLRNAPVAATWEGV